MSLSAMHPTQIRQMTVTSQDGTQIYAQSLGDPLKPALVLVYSPTMSTGIFTPIFENPAWSEQLFLVAYDLRGHGRSGKPVDDVSYESGRLAEDFDAVMNAFRVKKPFVMGLFFGATIIADILASQTRAYLSGIIYVEAVPYLGKGGHLPEKVLSETMSQRIPIFTSSDATFSIENFQQSTCSYVEMLGRSLPYPYQRAWLGDAMLALKSVIAHYLRHDQDERGLLTARDAGLPLLVVNPKLAETTDLRETMKAIGNWKNMKVVDMEKADHFPWFSDPDGFRREVTNWTAQVLRAAAI